MSSQIMFALQEGNKSRVSNDNAETNSTGWAKDDQSSHLIKPSPYLMTAKFQKYR